MYSHNNRGNQVFNSLFIFVVFGRYIDLYGEYGPLEQIKMGCFDVENQEGVCFFVLLLSLVSMGVELMICNKLLKNRRFYYVEGEKNFCQY